MKAFADWASSPNADKASVAMRADATVNFTAGRRTLKSERIHRGIRFFWAHLRGKVGRVTGEWNAEGIEPSRSRLFSIVISEVEGEDAFLIPGALKHFRMAEGANGIAITSCG
jgi:hypothetical protein